MFHYLKYMLFHLLVLPFVIGLTLGGVGLYIGFFATSLFVIAGDLFLGSDNSSPQHNHPWVLTIQLYASLLLILMVNFLMIWSVAGSDPLAYGAMVKELSGYDALAARETNTVPGYVVALLGCGLMTAVIGTIVGHELTHRTWDPVALFIGRWLLAFSWDTGFSIEHVYGHHVYVGSVNDPATAPRGRNVYHHIVASTIKGNISAWNLEKCRLQKVGQMVIGPANRYIRGILMSLVLEVIAFFIAGWMGVLFFTISAFIAKAILEIVNYLEHYGMVRCTNMPVQPHHSWNTNKRISSWATFNLTRHSHHHAEGDTPFQDLKPYQDAPMMVNGYLATIFLTLLPPLWHAIMIPKLLDWDKRYASMDELKLAAQANARSGIKRLQALDYSDRFEVSVSA